jgi:hypothetical protein
MTEKHAIGSHTCWDSVHSAVCDRVYGDAIGSHTCWDSSVAGRNAEKRILNQLCACAHVCACVRVGACARVWGRGGVPSGRALQDPALATSLLGDPAGEATRVHALAVDSNSLR